VKKPITPASATISGVRSRRRCQRTRPCHADQETRLERAAANADQRFHHDHQDSGLDAEERSVHHRDAPPEDVEQAESEHHQCARKHEQDPGGEAAAHPVQQPARVGRELLRLGARQQHAEVERVQIARLVDPLFLVDEDAVHHRDLPRRAAEPEAADLQPGPEGLPEIYLHHA
jgi:hypothetical protein